MRCRWESNPASFSQDGIRRSRAVHLQAALVLFDVQTPKRYGLTSSPVSHRRRGHGYLLLISTDQAHKSRLEMFDFLILTPKIFTRNKQQVKVTSPLQVPSKHPSHQNSDFILDFNSIITIELKLDHHPQPGCRRLRYGS
jgi:hypothetical protein